MSQCATADYSQKLGDYSLSRACRLVELDISGDGNELAPPPCDPKSFNMTLGSFACQNISYA